jgi:putative restriction endonuclease
LAAAKLDKQDLLDLFARSLRLSGWQTLYLADTHPAPARLLKAGQSVLVWLHIWNLTPGGRAQSRPFERRIQPTGIGDHFRSAKGGRTLILGWSSEAEVFAAFDYNFHDGPIGTSSSLQTDLPALEAAARDGLGVYAKSTGELSIAVRPDLLGIYVEQMDALHSSGTSSTMLEVLKRIAENPLDVQEADLLTQVPAQRRHAMTTTLRLLRDRRFGERVLEAYGHRCAFCSVQLRLLDAAHILPVAHPDSHDEVTNGVALCALHHRAYDGSLVTFDTKYDIRINVDLLAEVLAENKAGGLPSFRSALHKTLRLPVTSVQRPAMQMIEKANALRGW